MRVSATSQPSIVAGAIAKAMRDGRVVEIQSIGVRAVYQALKAVIISRSYLEADRLDVVVSPSFTLLDIEGKERTAVKLRIESRPREGGAPGPQTPTG